MNLLEKIFRDCNEVLFDEELLKKVISVTLPMQFAKENILDERMDRLAKDIESFSKAQRDSYFVIKAIEKLQPKIQKVNFI